MIEVKNLYKSFNKVPVLKGLNLLFPKAQTTVILGRSGVGKSVLLKHISGLEAPDSGEILIRGQSLFSLSPEKKEDILADMGMLFQSSALFDSLTIGENVSFSLSHNPLTQKKIRTQDYAPLIDEALNSVGLSGFQKKYPSELSGGQRRRAALARLIVYRPSILLFDEPTTGLDPITSMQINMLIAETQRTLQATCVVVTHDIVAALTIGDYFAFHHDGIIVTNGDKKTFFQDNNPILRHMLKCALVPPEWWPTLQLNQ